MDWIYVKSVVTVENGSAMSALLTIGVKFRLTEFHSYRLSGDCYRITMQQIMQQNFHRLSTTLK